MQTEEIRAILAGYESVSPGVKANLYRLLMSGRLGGTGRMIILPVDQGFEHGPARSFAPNPPGYDPDYHYQLAIDAGLSAFAAPLGLLEAGADRFAGQIPTILKANSANSLAPGASPKDSAITASVADALRLGCAAIGFTIYPGSSLANEMFEEIAELAEQAKQHGLAVVVWSYPRGEDLNAAAETALDICAYAAQLAALLGAHIIKVNCPPTTSRRKRRARCTKPRGSTFPVRRHGSGTSSRRLSPAAGWWCSREGPDVVRIPSMTMRGQSATAAETVQSSAATPSSARAKRPSRCSTNW